MQRAFQPGPTPQQLPAFEYHKVNSFGSGLHTEDAPEDLPEGAAALMEDTEISQDDRLVRAPGVTQDEALAHLPTQILLHAGFQYQSALLFLAPPWVGIKTNAATQWFNVGIPVARYARANFAGVLLLTPGVGGIYYHEPGTTIFPLVPNAPPGQALTVFANRVLVGGTQVGDDVDLMGVSWSAADSDYKNWTGEGAAAEVLIGNMERADRIQNFAPMGFSTLAIVNRRSLWTGERTGNVWEPIRFEPKLEDTGCSHADTVTRSEVGALFLADDGVRIFDGNQAPIVSDPINALLGLPIAEAAACTACLDPAHKRYYLTTPTATWILDLIKRRWYKWNATFLASVFFPDQGPDGPTWDAMPGTWDAQTMAWWQLTPQESGGKMYFVRGANLGHEDPAAFTHFGVNLVPKWQDRRVMGDNQDTLFTTSGAWVTYEAPAASSIELWVPSMAGDLEAVATTNLPIPATPSTTSRCWVPFIHTGRGISVGFRVVTGSPRIRKASVIYQVTSAI